MQINFDDMREGNIYRFWKDHLHFWVLRVNETGVTRHWCEILDKGEETEGMDVGQYGQIFKTSGLFKTYHSHQVHFWEGKETEPVSEIIKKAGRTKEEIEVDKLLAHVELTIKINRLQAQIDSALELGDESAFMKLTNEYNKLRKKVTA